jgi:hypothetical protein
VGRNEQADNGVVSHGHGSRAEPAPFSQEHSGDVNVVNRLPCRASFKEA